MWSVVMEWAHTHRVEYNNMDRTEETALNLWLVAQEARPGFVDAYADATKVIELACSLGLHSTCVDGLVEVSKTGVVHPRVDASDAEMGTFLGYVCHDHDIHDRNTPGWSYAMIARREDGSEVYLWSEVCKKRQQRKEVECEYQRRVDRCQRLLPDYRVHCDVSVMPIGGIYSQYDYLIRRLAPSPCHRVKHPPVAVEAPRSLSRHPLRLGR